MQNPESAIDLQRLRAAARRRWRRWAALGGGVLAASLAWGFFGMPQAYTSRVSIAFPQAAAGGLLSSLTGIASSSNKYLGIVKSTRLATEVEKATRLQMLYRLPTRMAAVQMIKEGLEVDDNARDGLLYISVTLKGPPRLAPGAAGFRERVRRAAATAASAYARALRRYISVSDVDKEAVLARAAEDRLRDEQAAYDRAVAALIRFVTRASQRTVGEGGGAIDVESARTQAAVLQDLYTRRAQIESDIQSVTASLREEEERRRELVENLDSVPLEDPLLAQTRKSLADKRIELETLRVQFGPAHPRVETARRELAVLLSQLQRQRAAALSGRTSSRAAEQARLESLRASLASIMGSIQEAERSSRVARESRAEYERLRNDVQIRLETLKATASNVATLQLQTLSAKSRLVVVDDARIPGTGSPGLILILAGSLVLGLAAAGGAAWLDYSRTESPLDGLRLDDPGLAPPHPGTHEGIGTLP